MRNVFSYHGWITDYAHFPERVHGNCNNHRECSSIPMVTNVLFSIVWRRLTPVRGSSTHKQRARFRPDRGWNCHISIFASCLKCATGTPTRESVFLDWNDSVDSFEQTTLFIGILRKFMSPLRSLFLHTSGRAWVYNKLSSSFGTVSGIRQMRSVSYVHSPLQYQLPSR